MYTVIHGDLCNMLFAICSNRWLIFAFPLIIFFGKCMTLQIRKITMKQKLGLGSPTQTQTKETVPKWKQKLGNMSTNDSKRTINDPILYILSKSQEICCIKRYKYQSRGRRLGHDRCRPFNPTRTLNARDVNKGITLVMLFNPIQTLAL